MKRILGNKQKWNKRGIELTINFIVTLILALAAFGLGAVIIRTLTTSGAESLTVTQDQLNSKISQLSCTARDKICVSNNNKQVSAGDLVISGINVFNYLNTAVSLTVAIEPKRAYTLQGAALTPFGPGNVDADMPSPLFSGATLAIEPRTQGQIAIGIKTDVKSPRGTYLFKVTVSDPNGLFTTISDEISVTVK